MWGKRRGFLFNQKLLLRTRFMSNFPKTLDSNSSTSCGLIQCRIYEGGHLVHPELRQTQCWRFVPLSVPLKIEEYLLSIGFSKRSDSLFVATSHNNTHTYLLYITRCDKYRLVMEINGNGVSGITEIFRGFSIRDVNDLAYLLGYNIFTSPVLIERKADVCDS